MAEEECEHHAPAASIATEAASTTVRAAFMTGEGRAILLRYPVGTCASAPVWWDELDGTVNILVGHDDEAWDMGVTIRSGLSASFS